MRIRNVALQLYLRINFLKITNKINIDRYLNNLDNKRFFKI